MMNLSSEIAFNAVPSFQPDGSARITWQSASNIALVKYWGKHGLQLPDNPSISLTLKHSVTFMELTAVSSDTGKGKLSAFYFENQLNPAFAERFGNFLQSLHNELPFLANVDITLKSRNTFPHSAGIASSASGFSALALCLCSLQQLYLQNPLDKEQFRILASRIARLGSGSACRSIYPGFSTWGKTPAYNGTDDKWAIDVNNYIHPLFQDLGDAILLVNTREKAVSSSQGHALMQHHPYRAIRVKQAQNNLKLLAESLKTGDWEAFISITENEALSLHALMMSSSPGFILMSPATIEIIHLIRAYRNRTSTPICFTLDAGPNIHLLYRRQDKNKIKHFIETELLSFCEDGRWIDDEAGNGPKRLNKYYEQTN
jgi:diphosphomevalonate decarboxylase